MGHPTLRYLVATVLLARIGLCSAEEPADAALATVTIGFTSNPPYAFQEGAVDKGIRLEIAAEVVKRAGYRFVPAFLPWKRAVESATSGKIDGISGIWFSAERTEVFYYPRFAFTFERTALYQKVGAKEVPYRDLADFSGLRIGVIRGYAFPKEFLSADAFTRDEASDLEQSLRKLSLGRVDVALAESDSGDYLLAGSDLKTAVYKNRNYLDAGVWNFLAFSKISASGKNLAKAYDDIIRKMIDDGTYQRIYRKYLGRAPERLPEQVLPAGN
jgi:polar amino acid transport system substrate-binding protein